MTSTHTFSCPVLNGLHARPATQLVDVAQQFEADITLTNERTGVRVNAKSILAVVSADIRLDDACRLEASGERAEAAIAALRTFVDATLPTYNEPDDSGSGESPLTLPRSLIETGASWKTGSPVSHGIGRGRVVNIVSMGFPDLLPEVDTGTPDEELGKLRAAMNAVRKSLTSQWSAATTDAQRGILTAHLAILDDVGLRSLAEESIRTGASAAQAIASTARSFAECLRAADSVLIRERAMDVEDIGRQLLEELGVASTRDAEITLSEPAIVVAENLTPRQLLSAERGLLRGLILEHSGTTSHTIILARSLRIPTLVGLQNACRLLTVGDEAIVDAHAGIVVRNPTSEVAQYYARETRTHERRRERLVCIAEHDAITSDGEHIKVAVNLSTAADIDLDVMKLADGVGLFRTETVFAGRETAPTEDEQYEVYRRVLAAARGERVVIRLYDVGIDKPLPYFPLYAEDNPALGCRGVRNYAQHLDLIRTQLRAVLRASATGPVGLLVPMVSSVEEIAQVKSWVAEVQAELSGAGVFYDQTMQFGVMIEVPIITHALSEVCEMVDFLSIGTNDLAQYFAAADRCNTAVAKLAEVRSPAFLRVLRSIVQAAYRHGRQVSMCGDMASQLDNLPLLIGLGLDGISVVGSDLIDIKAGISRRSAASCRSLLDAALVCRTVAEVEQLLDRLPPDRTDGELLSLDLTAVDVVCGSKAEAIKHLVDEMFVMGRTDDPRRLEEAIWEREDINTTGLGHGFAIPHCRSNAVIASSVVVSRLRDPVDWESIDDQPVRCVILLAMSEADQQDRHMTVFSTIARRLMHDDFRAGLLGADDAAALHAFLKEKLGTATSDDKAS